MSELSDNSMLHELCVEVRHIKGMVPEIFLKLDQLNAKQTEDKQEIIEKQTKDKQEIIDRIHSVEKGYINDNSGIKVKVAKIAGSISLIGILASWVIEHFLGKSN